MHARMKLKMMLARGATITSMTKIKERSCQTGCSQDLALRDALRIRPGPNMTLPSLQAVVGGADGIGAEGLDRVTGNGFLRLCDFFGAPIWADRIRLPP